MQTIITKYLGPTNARGSRIKARQSASYGFKPVSVTVSWDYSLSTQENHKAAAMAVADKLGWAGEWIGGDNGHDGLVFVNADCFSSPSFKTVSKEIAA